MLKNYSFGLELIKITIGTLETSLFANLLIEKGQPLLVIIFATTIFTFCSLAMITFLFDKAAKKDIRYGVLDTLRLTVITAFIILFDDLATLPSILEFLLSIGIGILLNLTFLEYMKKKGY